MANKPNIQTVTCVIGATATSTPINDAAALHRSTPQPNPKTGGSTTPVGPQRWPI